MRKDGWKIYKFLRSFVLNAEINMTSDYQEYRRAGQCSAVLE